MIVACWDFVLWYVKLFWRGVAGRREGTKRDSAYVGLRGEREEYFPPSFPQIPHFPKYNNHSIMYTGGVLMKLQEITLSRFLCWFFGHKPSNISKSYLWNSIKFNCRRCGKEVIK